MFGPAGIPFLLPLLLVAVPLLAGRHPGEELLARLRERRARPRVPRRSENRVRAPRLTRFASAATVSLSEPRAPPCLS
jgi:hypothetical protein